MKLLEKKHLNSRMNFLVITILIENCFWRTTFNFKVQTMYKKTRKEAHQVIVKLRVRVRLG